MVTGGTSGTYYAYGGVIATTLTGALSDIEITANTSGASAANVRSLNNGEAELAVVQNGCGKFVIGHGKLVANDKRALQFFLIPMVHWPETMVTWCAQDRLVFSGDAFGTFGSLDGGITDVQLDTSKYWDEMVRYYSNIVGKYGGPVQKALEKLAPLRCAIVCPTHGPVWTRDFPRVLDLYDRMSRYEPLEKGVVIAYGSMYGNTEQTAERLARELAARGVTKIVMHNLSSSHASLVIRDIFKYSALVIGSPTYNMGLYPEVRSLLDDLELRCIPKRVFGCFGGFTWAGAAVKRLTEFAERTGWGLVAPPVEVKQGFSPEKTASCAALADAIAATM